jgi:predicted MFS family arabinose efflux permease
MTLPLYYRQVYHLPESKIGLLLALNGIVVFSFEMIMVYILSRRYRIHELLLPGMLLIGLSFSPLYVFRGQFILFTSMIILSIAEILLMPFMATFTVQQSKEYNRGAYMGLYTIAYSSAFVLSPLITSQIISRFGFDTLWWSTGIVSILIGVGLRFITKPAKISYNSA